MRKLQNHPPHGPPYQHKHRLVWSPKHVTTLCIWVQEHFILMQVTTFKRVYFQPGENKRDFSQNYAMLWIIWDLPDVLYCCKYEWWWEGAKKDTNMHEERKIKFRIYDANQHRLQYSNFHHSLVVPCSSFHFSFYSPQKIKGEKSTQHDLALLGFTEKLNID